MKKTLIVLAALLMITGFASAQFRADIGVDIPWQLGATVTNAFGESEGESIDVLEALDFALILPEAFVGLEGQFGLFNLGIGARVFTVLVESLAYPAAFAEAEVGPVAINLQFGGGGFLLFGLYNDFLTGSVFIPDLSAHLRLGQSLRIGLGAAAFMGEEFADADVVPYIVYISGKFVIRF